VVLRLGQGTFRVAVTEAYRRACAITGEHSLPALEAAHIRSYMADGPHRVANGILLRADFHRLFDQGYVTITTDHQLLVGKRLRRDFANGRSYYPYQGKLIDLPRRETDQPAREYLEWHRETVFLG
jgi:putative restriction endonuclease